PRVTLPPPPPPHPGFDPLGALPAPPPPRRGRHAGNAAPHGRGPDLVAVKARPTVARAAERRVHDEVDLAGQDPLHDRRLAVGPGAVTVFTHDRGTDPVPAQHLSGARRGPDLGAEGGEALDRENH